MLRDYGKLSLVPRRSPPLSGEREGHVRAWERVGVPAGERLVNQRPFGLSRVSQKEIKKYFTK